jgi:hypothetical protein
LKFPDLFLGCNVLTNSSLGQRLRFRLQPYEGDRSQRAPRRHC